MSQLKHDMMTTRERMNALLAGEPVDRVPFAPFNMSCGTPGFCARNVGYPIANIYNNPQKSFWAQMWTQEQYGCDGSPIFGYASYGCWEFGGDIKFPSSEYEQAPMTTRYPVESEEDIGRLELPDVKTSGILPLAMRFSEMQAKFGMPVTLFMVSPLTCAVNIVGIGKLCRWLIKKPELAHTLLRLSTDHILQVSQLWVDTFSSKNVTVHEILPTESNQIISPEQFEEFAFPYLMEVHRKALAIGVKLFSTHICGDQNSNLPRLAQLPMGDIGIVSFGHEVDLTAAIRYFGDTCIIAGNINPSVIQTGTAEEVYELARQCIDKGKYAPRGYILTAGCDLPPFAPPYNVYTMRKALDDFGRYEE